MQTNMEELTQELADEISQEITDSIKKITRKYPQLDLETTLYLYGAVSRNLCLSFMIQQIPTKNKKYAGNFLYNLIISLIEGNINECFAIFKKLHGEEYMDNIKTVIIETMSDKLNSTLGAVLENNSNIKH